MPPFRHLPPKGARAKPALEGHQSSYATAESLREGLPEPYWFWPSAAGDFPVAFERNS